MRELRSGIGTKELVEAGEVAQNPELRDEPGMEREQSCPVPMNELAGWRITTKRGDVTAREFHLRECLVALGYAREDLAMVPSEAAPHGPDVGQEGFMTLGGSAEGPAKREVPGQECGCSDLVACVPDSIVEALNQSWGAHL
jgi:hypothetical protein